MDASVLNSIAARYGIAASELTALAGGHAAQVYSFNFRDRDYILRITPPNEEITLHSTRQILEWLAFLTDRAGPVSKPIRSLQGNLIEQVQSAGQLYLATAFEKAPGVLAERLQLEQWSDELFQSLGRAIGSCHRIACQYAPPEEYRRPVWEQVGNCFNPLDDLDGVNPMLLEKRRLLLDAIAHLPVNPDCYGLAHLDLHFGNFFVDIPSAQITFFDFDDCAYGWYLMDLAMLLFDVLVVYGGSDREGFGERFLEHLLRGYLSQKSLDPACAVQFPLFLKLVELGLYIMLYRIDDPADLEEWGSKFMPGRRLRVEQDIPYVNLDYEKILGRAALH
jgi:Ser/Thr protein kinase RdoA (MazF antagonist)